MDDNKPIPERLNELDPTIRDFLSKMEPEEVDTLKYLSKISKTELQQIMKIVRDARAFLWLGKWLIVTIVAVFMATAAIGEYVVKIAAWFKGAPPP